MPVATKVTEQLPGRAGEAFGYALSEPYNGVDHVIVSRIDMSGWGLRETRIVPAVLDEFGNVVILTAGDNTLAMSIPLALCSHEDALSAIGYTAVGMLEEVPPGDPDMKIEPTPEEPT